MLLDIGSVLGGIGLAVVAFLVVILVCVVILRLLAAILPSYEERDAARLAASLERGPEDEDIAAGDTAPVETNPGKEGEALSTDPGEADTQEG